MREKTSNVAFALGGSSRNTQHRTRLVGCFAFVALAVPLLATAAPSLSTNLPPISPALPDASFSVIRVFGALVLVLGLFLAGVWLFRNWQRLALRRGQSSQLQILE